MHEMAICSGLVDVVLEEWERLDPPPRRLHGVRVIAGALHQLVPEFLETAYELLTRGTPAEGSRLELVIQPVTAVCPSCGWSGSIAPPFFRCGGCADTGIELRTGKELYLDQLNVEPEPCEETE